MGDDLYLIVQLSHRFREVISHSCGEESTQYPNPNSSSEFELERDDQR